MVAPLPASDAPVRFGWNASRAQYYDRETGRFVRPDFVRSVLETRFNEAAETMRRYTVALEEGRVTAQQWRDAMQVELRRAHAQVGALGRGGWDQMTHSDWGRLGATLRKEYGYLNEFARAVDAGELTEALVRSRMEQYANGLQKSFWKGMDGAMAEAGAVEEARFLTPADHCDDCVSWAAKGWQPLGSLPAPGEESKCRSGCACGKKYRKANGEEFS